jgi:TrmH family RNA methyltransferase
MESPLITSRRNPLVARLRALAARAGREREGLLLLEGTHGVQELQGAEAAVHVAELVATPDWISRHPQLLEGWSSALRVHQVSETVLQASLSTVHPDGVACLLPLSALPQPPAKPEFVLALDRLQDPGNLGTLLRTALAAEVEVVWQASGADPFGTKVVRSSAGSILRLPVERFGPGEDSGVRTLAEKLQGLRDRGVQVVATLVPGARVDCSVVPYWELDWTRPTALVLGNEGGGLHGELLACCSHGVTLPHSAKVESLNVASAAVPLLLERRRATMTAPTQLTG